MASAQTSESAGPAAAAVPQLPMQALEHPAALTVIVAICTLAYGAGVLWWYGPQLNDVATPVWAWPFVPDCPLFGLLGGLALLQNVAQRRWSRAARRRLRLWMVCLGVAALALGGLAGLGALPWVAEGARAQAALWTLAGASLLLVASLPGRPLWLAGVAAVLIAGQIKYGFWTLTLWGLFWRNTALLYGAPLISAEGVLMVIAHIALMAQGFVLWSRLPAALHQAEAEQPRPRSPAHAARTWAVAALSVLVWFALSDFIDYALGFHPAVHQLVALQAMRDSTRGATLFLSAVFLLMALQAAILAQRGRPIEPHV